MNFTVTEGNAPPTCTATATLTPLSEILGSTPEETKEVNAAAKEKVVIKTFKGVSTKMEFEYRPLREDELYYESIEDGINFIYTRRCNVCLEPAEHGQVTEADPYYIKYLCTVCRDKAAAPKKVKEVRETKMVRYAGFHRSKPSYTADEFEIIKKNMEAKIKEAQGTDEVITETQPV